MKCRLKFNYDYDMPMYDTVVLDPSEYSIIPGMSVVPKVRIRDFQNK